MAPRIGFDRRVQLRWLDALVDHLLQETDARQTRRFLHELIAAEHPGQTARSKTVSVMMRMWVTVPREQQALRGQALEQVRQGSATDYRWLHWGMSLLAFPVFGATASNVGRLLTVQGDFTLAQIQLRLSEVFGERSTLERASQRVVSSMVEWGLLVRSGRKGEFRGVPHTLEATSPLQLWLLEAVLSAGAAEEVEATRLLCAPELFPFHITVSSADLRSCGRFDVHRQGVDMDIVALRSSSTLG